jgi:hypothetical protein
VREGTDATVRLAISPELEGITGKYFDGQHEAHADDQAYDPEARARLRRIAEELTGLRAQREPFLSLSQDPNYVRYPGTRR